MAAGGVVVAGAVVVAAVVVGAWTDGSDFSPQPDAAAAPAIASVIVAGRIQIVVNGEWAP